MFTGLGRFGWTTGVGWHFSPNPPWVHCTPSWCGRWRKTWPELAPQQQPRSLSCWWYSWCRLGEDIWSDMWGEIWRDIFRWPKNIVTTSFFPINTLAGFIQLNPGSCTGATANPSKLSLWEIITVLITTPKKHARWLVLIDVLRVSKWSRFPSRNLEKSTKENGLSTTSIN